MKASNVVFAVGLSGLMAMAPVADAQRVDVGGFEGVWKGTLNMSAIYDIPPELVERLSKPVQLELRIFARGGAELYFTFEEDEWEFTEQRNFRITPIAEESGTVNNGVIDARLRGNLGWTTSMALNMALQGEDSLFLNWTRLTVRDQLLYDGLDEMGFAGTAVLTRQGE